MVKQKYNDAFMDKEIGLSTDQQTGLHNLSANQTQNSCRPHSNGQVSGKLDKVNNLNIKWEEASGSMVYNEISKSLDLGNLRSTNYKYNKEVFGKVPSKNNFMS